MTDKQPRYAASEALLALREAMGKTQQQFAVELLGSAITTVARYETSHPPAGDVLLKLAEIADKNGHIRLGERFRMLYVEDVFTRFGNRIIVVPGAGYYLAKLTSPDEIDAAQCLMTLLDRLRSKDPKQKAAARGVLTAIQAIRNTRHPKANEFDAAQRQFFTRKGTEQ